MRANFVLVKLVEKFSKLLPPGAVLGRVGGDEFAVYLNGMQSVSAVEKLVQKLLQTECPICFCGREISFTLSAGVVIIEPDGPYRTVDALLNNCEVALCVAKERGKNQYALFDAAYAAQSDKNSSIINSLRQSLASDSLILEFQPLFNLQTGRFISFEVLSRLKDPVYGIIPPTEFIPLAQSNNLILSLDHLVLNKACETVAKLNEMYHGIHLSVNISPVCFMSPNFFDTVKAAVERWHIAPGLLSIELTESSFIESLSEAKAVIESLSALGVKTFLDDFGTGYANLVAIGELPVHFLKMDKSLIDKVYEDKDNVLVKNTIELAKLLNMNIVAEGIETQDQLEVLKKLNCEIGQGFLLGRPMPLSQVITFLNENQEM